MKYVALPVNESRSNRFETFLELLGEDENLANRMVVWGHLCHWYTRWGSDPEYDHGVLWNITEKRLGIWAEWPEPLKFGRALAKAGYVAKLSAVYGRDEEGFVVLNGDGGVALEVSWDGWHRKSPIRAKLAHYLTDPVRRDQWLEKFEYDGSAAAVALDGGPVSRSGRIPGEMDPDGQAASAAGRGGSTVQFDRGGGSGNIPESFRSQSGEGPGALRPPSGIDVKDVKNVKEGTNVPTSDVTGQGAVNNCGRGGGRRTGKPKTVGQRDFIREHRYDDTMSCLLALDETDDTVKLWREACAKDLPFMQELLSNIVETDGAWAALANPCGAVVSKTIKHMQQLRRRRRRGAA